ncbi:hypothetical protein [Sutcliffiella rhizosphaerae]|uniref:Uncharacterized protein n=1 Tax=Sutcliffiella rhizosphaerae TaxID=2880967 RepID=A0ABN8A7K0_9BACI|nr:hypothetical protein [Sutcliffiella rhizosphaerae]CAG9621121.1 hypothetical protein BACCIP111883_01893 [Sutcliffiella rhizosphaerae]
MENNKADNSTGWYLYGFITLVFLWIVSFIVSAWFEQMTMLLVRLTLNGIAISYFLTIYFIQLTKHFLSERRRQNEIIIQFNGREIMVAIHR